MTDAWYLKRVQLLRELSSGDMRRLSEFGHERSLVRRQQIVAPSDAGEAVFLILDGRVRLSEFEADGSEMALAVLEEGELFGLGSIQLAAPRSFLAEAIESVRLNRLSTGAFAEFLGSHHAARQAVTRAVKDGRAHGVLPDFLSPTPNS